MSELDATIEQVRAWIREAQRVVVLTGAGISTESGIQDFRGPQGLWTLNPKAEKMADLRYYMTDPEVRKNAWQNRASRIRQAEPNDGHRALVALEQRGRLHTLITQNVDGLHQAAGTSPEIIVEIHGTMREVVCMECRDRAPMEVALERVRNGEEDPACKLCGGILKSATISFGQSMVPEDVERAEQSALGCDFMFAIGSTLGVFPAAAVVPIAKSAGARVVILNGEPTEMDQLADAVLNAQIGDVLPRICALDA